MPLIFTIPNNRWFSFTSLGGHIGVQNNTKCMNGICIKIEFGCQRRERPLFLYTNMAAVTSRENDLLNHFLKAQEREVPFLHKGLVSITHEQDNICSKTLICRQLFAGHVVGSRQMKRKEKYIE